MADATNSLSQSTILSSVFSCYMEKMKIFFWVRRFCQTSNFPVVVSVVVINIQLFPRLCTVYLGFKLLPCCSPFFLTRFFAESFYHYLGKPLISIHNTYVVFSLDHSSLCKRTKMQSYQDESRCSTGRIIHHCCAYQYLGVP